MVGDNGVRMRWLDDCCPREKEVEGGQKLTDGGGEKIFSLFLLLKSLNREEDERVLSKKK